MIEAFLHGVLLAFGLILPLGVQNVFVFNQGANQPSFYRALPAVITASLCDTFLILLAVLGVSVVVLSFAWLKTVLLVFGVGFITYMGWSIWKSQPAANKQEIQGFSMKKQVAFAASVSLLNPHAILDTIGVIGTSSLKYAGDEKWLFTLATILISWAWFFGLALAGRLVGGLDKSGHWMKRMNQVSAILIWCTALFLIWSLKG